MIKNNVNPVAAEGASSEEGAGGKEGEREEGGEKGDNGYWRTHTQKTRQCLLISRNVELQTGWQAGRWVISLL